MVTGEGLASRSSPGQPLSVSGKGIVSLLIYLEQHDSRVLLQEAVTAAPTGSSDRREQM